MKIIKSNWGRKTLENAEKRRFLRFINESDVKIKIKDSVFSYPMRDFSAGGFRIDYIEGFEIGQVFEVVIDFDFGQFATEAKVKWQGKEKGIGFEFVDIELFS